MPGLRRQQQSRSQRWFEAWRWALPDCRMDIVGANGERRARETAISELLDYIALCLGYRLDKPVAKFYPDRCHRQKLLHHNVAKTSQSLTSMALQNTVLNNVNAAATICVLEMNVFEIGALFLKRFVDSQPICPTCSTLFGISMSPPPMSRGFSRALYVVHLTGY